MNTYLVLKNELYGRYLVVAKDLKVGEVIIQEKAVMVGAQLKAFSLCFKCLKPLVSHKNECLNCQTAFVCSEFCKGNWHTEEECKELKKMHISKMFLEQHPYFVLPLRLFLFKFVEKTVWEEILQLADHWNERKDTTIAKVYKELYIPFEELSEYPDKTNKEKWISEEVFQKLSGVLDVNSFAVRPKEDNPKLYGLRGLFLKASLMAHDCTSNVHIAVDENFIMAIRASRPLKKGDMIVFNYAEELHGTALRNKHLQIGKYFTCNCLRCHDPLEFGTHLSSIKCPKCRQWIQPSEKKYTTCCNCDNKFSSRMLKTLLKFCQEFIDECDYSNLQEMLNLKKKLVLDLHENHYYLVGLNQHLASAHLEIGENNRNSLKEAEKLIVQLLQIINVLEPGLSRHKGICLHQLFKVRELLLKQHYKNNTLPLPKYFDALQTEEKTLKESLTHLIYEPKDSNEGRLARTAMIHLQALRKTLQEIERRLNN